MVSIGFRCTRSSSSPESEIKIDGAAFTCYGAVYRRVYSLRRQVSGMRAKEAETRAEMASQDEKWQQVVELMQQVIAARLWTPEFSWRGLGFCGGGVCSGTFLLRGKSLLSSSGDLRQTDFADGCAGDQAAPTGAGAGAARLETSLSACCAAAECPDVECTGIFVFSGMLLWIFSVCVLQKASFAFWTACARAWGEKSFAKHRAVGLILHSQAGTPPPACGSEPKTATPSLLKCSRTNLFPSRSRPALFSVLFFCVAEPRLLERDEPRGFGGADTGATVRDRLVCDGELAEVVASHLRLQKRQKTQPSATCFSSFDNMEVEADSIVADISMT